MMSSMSGAAGYFRQAHAGLGALVAITAVCGVFLTAPAAFAIPALQLDILGGTYDTETETIVATSKVFTLYALLNTLNGRVDPTDTYFVSAAVVPRTTPAGVYGTFDFDGDDLTGIAPVGNGDTTIEVTGEMAFGTVPFETYEGFDPGDLATHGIFETFYTEFAFTFDSDNTAALYNAQDTPGAGPSSVDMGPLLWSAFTVDTHHLSDDLLIHFDLYSVRATDDSFDPDYDRHLFAPFSHDAQSVPEPSTMLLFGTGLLGLIAYARRRKED